MTIGQGAAGQPGDVFGALASRLASCWVRSRSKSLGSNRGDVSISASKVNVGSRLPGQDPDADRRIVAVLRHADGGAKLLEGLGQLGGRDAMLVPWSSNRAVRCATPTLPSGSSPVPIGTRSDT